jgi:pilus assembly protein CpaF
VSKRHATIVARQGRLTVVDLKSTNGTYVNGRRISTPKEIGPDDRIYIGDFTLRVNIAEPGAEPVLVPASQPAMPAEAERRQTLAMPAMPPMPPTAELSGERPVALDLDVEAVAVEPSDLMAMPPLPPEEESVAETPAREADAAPVAAAVSPAMAAWQGIVERAGSDLAARPAAEPDAVADAPGAERVVAPTGHSRSQVASMARHPGTGGERGPADQYMTALRRVAARAGDEVFAGIPPERTDFADHEWASLSEGVMQLVDQLRRQDQIPAGVDPYTLSQDVLYEFTGLGPLEELFGDEHVRAITVDGIDRLFAVRGLRSERVGRSFASVTTMQRVVTKLCMLASIDPKEPGAHLEGRLPDGTSLTILRAPLVSEGAVLALERQRGTTLTAEDLVAGGVMDEAALRMLRAAVRKHRNVVICGPRHSGKSVFLNAVLRLAAEGDRMVVVESRREVALSQPDVVCMNKEALLDLKGRRSCLLGRLAADIVVLSDLGGEDIDLLTRLSLGGQKGIIATMVADSAEACLRRLDLLVLFANPPLREESVRAVIRQGVDVVVVLGSSEDGRSRVVEIAEVDHAHGTLKIAGTAG